MHISRFIFALCIVACAGFAPALAEPVLVLSSETSLVNAGDDIVVIATLSDGYDLSGYYLEIEADTTALLPETSLPAAPIVPQEEYVFGDSSGNFIGWVNDIPQGSRSGYSDFFQIGDAPARRDQATNAGDILAVVTIPTDIDQRGTVSFSINADTLELLDTNLDNIAEFDQLLTAVYNQSPLAITVVPEPATLLLLSCGAISLYRRRGRAI